MDNSTFIDVKARPRERVDIRVGTERRRRWSREEKLHIVRESLEPNAVISDVARRNEIAPSLIYVWRRQALAGLIEGFHQVRVVPEVRQLESGPEAPQPLPAIECNGTKAAEVASVEPTRAAIEVTLPNGTVVRVDGAADAKALRAVLGALVER